MKHKNIDYRISDIPVGTGKWRYAIYADIELGHKVVSPQFYATRKEAEEACKKAIEAGFAAAK